MEINNWKDGNHKLVGEAFHKAYDDRMHQQLPIIGEIDMGCGEREHVQRGSFKTVGVPGKFEESVDIGYKQAKVDKFSECKKAGTRLGDAAAMTVLKHTMELFANAYSDTQLGGDGVSWANAAHPVASKSSNNRVFVPDEDAGTYSNLITDALSVTVITKAQGMARRFVTPDGLPFLCNMDCVLVSPELEATAKKLLGENTACGIHYIVVGGSLGGFSAKQWALCDSRLMKELVKLIWIACPTVWQNRQGNPLIDHYTGYANFSIGWGDARQIIFSNPD